MWQSFLGIKVRFIRGEATGLCSTFVCGVGMLGFIMLEVVEAQAIDIVGEATEAFGKDLGDVSATEVTALYDLLEFKMRIEIGCLGVDKELDLCGYSVAALLGQLFVIVVFCLFIFIIIRENGCTAPYWHHVQE